VNVNVENAVDMPKTEDNELTEVAPPEPLVEPLLRRSTRERNPSQKYSPHEFVLLTNGGSLNVMKKLCCIKRKISGSKSCKRR